MGGQTSGGAAHYFAQQVVVVSLTPRRPCVGDHRVFLTGPFTRTCKADATITYWETL